MEKIKIDLNINDVPASVHPFMQGAAMYDSSCSDHAKVYYSDLGYYIKVENKGLLEGEAKLVTLFAGLGLGPEMMLYLSEDKDYVVSFEMKDGGITNKNGSNTLSAPSRVGYIFKGWGINSSTDVAEFTMETISGIEFGRRVFAIWDEVAAE